MSICFVYLSTEVAQGIWEPPVFEEIRTRRLPVDTLDLDAQSSAELFITAGLMLQASESAFVYLRGGNPPNASMVKILENLCSANQAVWVSADPKTPIHSYFLQKLQVQPITEDALADELIARVLSQTDPGQLKSQASF